MSDFEEKVFEKFAALEADIGFIKGELSGRNHRANRIHSRWGMGISMGAFFISIALLIVKIFFD